jgi:hypothetical protein
LSPPRWSPDGADRMARLLAAQANGELDRHTGPVSRPGKPTLKVPALDGPCQRQPYVKYALR